jgi:hypothetical protein
VIDGGGFTEFFIKLIVEVPLCVERGTSLGLYGAFLEKSLFDEEIWSLLGRLNLFFTFECLFSCLISKSFLTNVLLQGAFVVGST